MTISEGAEAAIYEAWAGLGEWKGKNRPEPKALAAKLQTRGHEVSYKTVLRRYAQYKAAETAYKATEGAARWRLTDARDAEEIALILPGITISAEEGRELSKDEAAIFLALRRALPLAAPGFALSLTYQYDRARRGESAAFGPTHAPYTVNEIEEWVAFAHVDQTQPGSLANATEAGQVRNISGSISASDRLAEPRIHTCGRKFWTNENYERHAKDCDGAAVTAQKGGKGHGKTRSR